MCTHISNTFINSVAIKKSKNYYKASKHAGLAANDILYGAKKLCIVQLFLLNSPIKLTLLIYNSTPVHHGDCNYHNRSN
jgi:hypothetical protein